MIELRGINKVFPSNGVKALDNAEFTLRPGEIHALLGENGAGKSTLMHILAGFFPPSSGKIIVDGKERRFNAPAAAVAQKIGMVRQHPGYVRGFKVWEDCILGAEGGSSKMNLRSQNANYKLFFDPALLRKRACDLSARWGFDLPLDERADTLTVSQRQKAAVLSLLLRDVKWFIFDEPTAVLTPDESKKLFELFHRLRCEGKGIVLITHKLDEALAASDRITVMRNGQSFEPQSAQELSVEELKNLISSHKDTEGTKDTKKIKLNADPRTECRHLLEVKNLKIEIPGLPHIRNLSFSLEAGKILGIAGVRDSGLETLELSIAGLLRHSANAGKIEGSISLNGSDITGKGVRAFRDAGGAYLGADRLGSNLARELPVSESLIIHAFRRMRQGVFLNTKALGLWSRKIMEQAGIDRSPSDGAASFSGGMTQRILLAREFAEEPKLLVLAEPGSGLDQLNRQKLAEELKTLVSRGASALLFSTDMEELQFIADEIKLLSNGTLYEN